MEYQKFENTYVLRVNKGEEIVSKIKELCEKEDIKLAEITGLGASNLVEIGLFNVNTKEYKTNTFEGMFEITSLVGNATTKDGNVYLHLHINFSDDSNNVKGGHLVRCNVSATSEIIINKIDGIVERNLNEEIGLNLMKFKK